MEPVRSNFFTRCKDVVLYHAPWQINVHAKPGKQIIVPMKLRNSLMELAHTGMTGGHLEFEKTKEQVQRRAYWPGFSKDVFRYCRECEACARYKKGPALKQGLLEPMKTGTVMERLNIHITRPHPISSAGQIPSDGGRPFLEMGRSFSDSKSRSFHHRQVLVHRVLRNAGSIGSLRSKWHVIGTGVPQGSELEPRLYVLFTANVLEIAARVGAGVQQCGWHKHTSTARRVKQCMLSLSL